jgi:site-specific DNA-methyltransferase (adenine-specific)
LIERLSDDSGAFRDFIALNKPAQRTDIKIEPPSLPVKQQLYKEQKGICNGCALEFNIQNLEIDHIIPQKKGGGDYYENYQLLCANCNRSKGVRPMAYLLKRIRQRAEQIEKLEY